ncbi:MAG: type I restriction-modification system subunit M [Clostridia bacterium]|nr:type I restriction-modification system subunit M [Clostridia bacterium]
MASNREREELHKAIWSIADELRGSVDGWDFKQYILGIMFYRYISENITNYINEGERKAGETTFDYAKLRDSEAEFERENLVKEKGFFIRPSELFCNVIKSAKSDTATFTDVEGKTKSVKDNLNEYLEMIFNNIENSAKGAESEDDFSGLFDDIDVNSNKLGATVAKRNEKLVKILDGIAGINLGNYQDNNIDAFGDAYEFLMSMYASNAGKSGGEFYTPQEVSELLTRLAIVGKTSVNKVYDPACGSGSLLLKSAKILGKDNVRNGFFGQEINLTTYNLCRINMFLHDIDYDKFDIACEDTLITPMHWDDEPFEVIVSNPPYSIKWAGDDNAVLINDPRYSPAGVLAPKSKADFAFIMHSLSWLATNGVASIVCFPGILYRNGAEQKIRKYLIDNNFVDCIIQLPDNLFFGTSIATCIMVLKKGKKDNSTLFIDASRECVKVTNNNQLTERNIADIVKIFENREDVEYTAKLVSNKEIEENDYNLSVSTYVEQEDTREHIDIDVLNKEIDEIVEREQELRDEIKKIISEIEV